MKTLASKHQTRRIAASIAIVTALAAAQTALAAVTPIYWKGGNGSEADLVNIYSKSSWTGSTTYSGSDISKFPCNEHNLHFGFAAEAEDTTAWLKCDGNEVETAIANWLITHSGHFIFTSGSFTTANAYIGYSSGDNSTVTKKGGDWTIGAITLGNGSGSSGAINLNGGVIKTKKIVKGSGTAAFNFNGGTLQANADNTTDFIGSGVTVNVGEGGGTIDNGGYDVKIVSALGGADDTGRLHLTGDGTTTLSNSTIENGKIVVDGGTVNFGGTMYIGKSANTVGLLEINGGTVNLGDSIDVGNRGTGVLTINDGTLVIDSVKRICLGYYSSSSGTMNLNGGILKTSRIVKNGGNSALNINGGTLKANAANTTDFIGSSVTVNVVSGGTIDNGGFNIKIPAALSGSGRLTFKGSGTTTLSGSVSSYSGVTRVVAGSTPCVSKAIATKLLSNGLALSGAPVVGTPYTVLSCDEDLSDLSLGNVTCPVATGCTVTLGDGNTSIVVTPTGAIKSGYWTGIKDANMSDPANWSDGVVPADGADIDLSGATKVNGDLGYALGAVTMGSSVVTFTGSFTATSFSDTSKVAVGANSTVTLVGNLEFSGSANEYICNTVAAGGRFAVTGDIVVKAAKGNNSYLTPSLSSCAGVIAAKGLVKEKEGGTNYGRMFKLAPDGGHVNWEIGEDGISGKNYFFVSSTAGSSAKIAATANFMVSAAIANLNNLEFDAAGWTITLGDGSSGGIQGSGSTTVSGTGSVVVNYDVANLTTTAANMTQPFTVSGSVTLVLASGANIGTGSITLGAGTTLALTATGREFTPLANTLNLPTTGTATLRIDGTRLKSGDNVIATVGNEATTDNVTLDSKSAALEGRHASLRVKEGDLVLDITPDGLMIIFR